MVTQLYTAPLRPYLPQKKGVSSPAPKPQPDDLQPSGDAPQHGPSQTLAAMQEKGPGNISIQAVLSDFQNTMDALGVTQPVREEVAPYLQVVAHQAQKPQPSSGLIKQNLRIAAETMDQYITQTLGKPSNVVREWVDALLLQPINYHSDTPIELRAFAPTPPAEIPRNAPASTVGTKLPTQDGAWVKARLNEAKAAMANNAVDEAMGHYQGILDHLNGSSAHPDVEARVLYQMGRAMEKASKPAEAKGYYEQANAKLPPQSHPKLEMKVHKALGMLLYQEGQLDSAAERLTQAVELSAAAEPEGNHSSLLNQLGITRLRLGQHEAARGAFEKALQQAQAYPNAHTSDILSNLGAVHRKTGEHRTAFGYYKQSLQAAQAENNRDGMRQSLQAMAALYLDAGKPEKAFKALENALYRV